MKLKEWENTTYYQKKFGGPKKGRLIVFEEHGTDNHIFLGETWEQITDAMRAKITERASYGYYCCNKEQDMPEKPFTDEELAKAPATMKKQYEQVMNQYKRKVEQVEENNHLYECLQAALNGDRNAAAHFFSLRSDYEDEQFWLDNAHDPAAYLEKVKGRIKKK